jgi:general secretion pathway protein E
MGFYGRTGIFAFVPVDEELKNLIRNKASLAQIQAHAGSAGATSLYDQALAKVLQGITSVQEVLRVCKPKADK